MHVTNNDTRFPLGDSRLIISLNTAYKLSAS
jgi:hypothetical protein